MHDSSGSQTPLAQKLAAALIRALEVITLRVAGAEDVKPYPGLASFTETDREYFFGREAEVETVWKKLQVLFWIDMGQSPSLSILSVSRSRRSYRADEKFCQWAEEQR